MKLLYARRGTRKGDCLQVAGQAGKPSLPKERSVAILSFIGPPGCLDRGATWAEYMLSL